MVKDKEYQLNSSSTIKLFSYARSNNQLINFGFETNKTVGISRRTRTCSVGNSAYIDHHCTSAIWCSFTSNRKVKSVKLTAIAIHRISYYGSFAARDLSMQDPAKLDWETFVKDEYYHVDAPQILDAQ